MILPASPEIPDRPAPRTAPGAALEHGGALEAARRAYPDVNDWVDLSTGINPWPYPTDGLALEHFARLPERGRLEPLEAAARTFYRVPAQARVVPAPGSQSIVQILPLLRRPSRVAVVGFTYGEHAHCWRRAGHDVVEVDGLDAAAGDAGTDVAVLVNPNNPDGRVHPRAGIAAAARELAARGGWLVVDEAFADVAPDSSAVGLCSDPGVIALRSFGKFFGLSGLRLGFAIAAPPIAARLAATLGPWPVSGPAIAIGTRALADRRFERATRARLADAAGGLRSLLAGAALEVVGGTDLYVLVEHPEAQLLHHHLAARGLLTRSFSRRPRWLRIGLPPDDAAAARLEHAFAQWHRGVRPRG